MSDRWEIAYRVLGEAVHLSATRVEVGLLEAWQHLHDPPYVWVVAGRIAVGKSAFVNRLAGSKVSPVGLLGTTRAPVEVETGDLKLLDTPGIDDPFDGLDGLEARIPAVDGVVWVTDALQPMTASERRILDDPALAGVPVAVALGRLDLVDEGERAEVRQRVERLVGGGRWRVAAADDPAWRQILSEGVGLASPRRRDHLRRVLLASRAAWSFLPPPPDPADEADRRRAAARERWRLAGEEVAEGVRRGDVLTGEQARRALLAAAGRGADAEEPDLWSQVRDLVRGTPGVLRDLTAEVARRQTTEEREIDRWLTGEEAGQLRRDLTLDAEARAGLDRALEALGAPAGTG